MWMITAAIPVALTILPFLPSALAAHPNATAARSLEERWTSATCANVAGSYHGYAFNFGCICSNDLDDFAWQNGINWDIRNVLMDYLVEHGETRSYPPNAQPTCDGNGGYSCGSLSRLSNGECGHSSCDATRPSTNGGCCTRGQTYYMGKCCSNSGITRAGDVCTPNLSCSTYQSNEICCPAGTDGWIGHQTVCCPVGQYEVDGVCVCPSGDTDCVVQTTTSSSLPTSTATSSTPSSTEPSSSTSTDEASATATLAHPQQRDWRHQEVARNAAPTHRAPAAPQPSKRFQRPVARDSKVQQPAVPAFHLGMAENLNSKLCPRGMAACPLPGAAGVDGSYECLDALNDLTSCGGCAALGQGQDCTAIPGVRWMGCNIGRCEVYSCRRGWMRTPDGTACVRV